MAISSDQSLLAISGMVPSTKSNDQSTNFVYLFNMNLIKNDFNLTLIDTIELKSSSNDNKKETDHISSLHFVEKDVDRFLISLTKTSAVLNLFGVSREGILRVCEAMDFSEEHDLGNCRLFNGESGNKDNEFYLVSSKGLINRLEFLV